MHQLTIIALSSVSFLGAVVSADPLERSTQIAPNGIALPEGYKDWAVIST